MDLRGKLQNEQLQMADSVKTLQLKLSDEKGELYLITRLAVGLVQCFSNSGALPVTCRDTICWGGV